jgi:hypothetical protein
MAKGHRGRPRKAQARSRATTRAGRAPPPDLGTKEVRRLRQILNGRLDLPVDPLSALYSREFINERSYIAGRRYSGLVSAARMGWAIPNGSVAYWWKRIVAGPVDAGGPGELHSRLEDDGPSSVDAARLKLESMRRELMRPGEDGSVLFTVNSVCLDGVWSSWLKRLLTRWPERAGDFKQLGQLREGLARLVEVSRRREGAPARELAAE